MDRTVTIKQVIFPPFGIGTTMPTSAAPPDGDSGTRYINPGSRDYERDTTTGHLAQMPSKRQRVLLALLTVRGSVSVDPLRGVVLPRKMTPTFVEDMRQSVRSALHYMTDVERSITVDSIDVLKGARGRAQVTVSFTDLETGEQDSVDVG